MFVSRSPVVPMGVLLTDFLLEAFFPFQLLKAVEVFGRCCTFRFKAI